jgi:hypothetical protein
MGNGLYYEVAAVGSANTSENKLRFNWFSNSYFFSGIVSGKVWLLSCDGWSIGGILHASCCCLW